MKISDQVASLQSIRDRNAKVDSLGGKVKQHLPEIDPIHEDGGEDATLPQKQAAFTDIIIGAMASGLTNVVTYTIDDLGTDITSLPENKQKTSIHQIGHGGQISGAADMRNAIKFHHMKQVKTLVTKLKAIPEGDGTMFDNTTIIYMPETGSGHHGPDTEAPMIVMTGKNSKLDIAGRYIRLPFHGTKGHKTLSNWYTTLLNAYGNPIKHYGDLDLTMQRNRLEQTGSAAGTRNRYPAAPDQEVAHPQDRACHRAANQALAQISVAPTCKDAADCGKFLSPSRFPRSCPHTSR